MNNKKTLFYFFINQCKFCINMNKRNKKLLQAKFSTLKNKM